MRTGTGNHKDIVKMITDKHRRRISPSFFVDFSQMFLNFDLDSISRFFVEAAAQRRGAGRTAKSSQNPGEVPLAKSSIIDGSVCSSHAGIENKWLYESRHRK